MKNKCKKCKYYPDECGLIDINEEYKCIVR